jgi:cellulose synthase/poly-beta-1,6-N-acetylglucosamine synthase-like glycosyltransferase
MLFWFFIGLPAVLAVVHLVQVLGAWANVQSARRNPPKPGTFTPKVAIFVPCKGLDADLEANLDAVAQQDYPDYSVTYIVESANDAAYDAIRKVVARRPHTGLVVAGLARSCGQKNHNLLQGIAARGNGAEALVFCDSDTKPDTTWLRRLVAPLAEAKTPVATGFRWIVPAKESRTLGGYLHAMFNGYMSTLIANKAFAAVWGGSMAIRRDFWEKYGVAEIWAHTVVDDMTISELLVKHRVRRAYVLSCLVISDEAIPSLRAAMDWFTRQIAYVRYHLFPFWVAALVAHGLSALVVLAAPLQLAYGWYSGDATWLWGGIAGALFMAYFTAQALLIRSLGPHSFSPWIWIALTPIGTILGPISVLEAGLTNSLRWRDTTYELGAGGRVLSISRGAATPEPGEALPVTESVLSESLNKE